MTQFEIILLTIWAVCSALTGLIIAVFGKKAIIQILGIILLLVSITSAFGIFTSLEMLHSYQSKGAYEKVVIPARSADTLYRKIQ